MERVPVKEERTQSPRKEISALWKYGGKKRERALFCTLKAI